MLKNYIKIAIRNLLKNKVFSLINILGLAIGMAACLLILQYVRFELSYDEFHPEAEQLFRVTTVNFNNGEAVYSDAMSFNGVGLMLKERMPEVLAFARVRDLSQGIIIQNGEDVFTEKEVMLTDPSFLELFNYPLIQGNPATALTEPFTIVMTRSMATKYFGDENPIGKVLQVPTGRFTGDYEVVGLIDDVPGNTHLKFDMLIAYDTFWSVGEELNWNAFNDYTYIKVAEGTDPEALQEKIRPLSKEYISEESTLVFYLQPMMDIHLHSNMSYEAEVNGSAQSVHFLSLIAIFIIFIAWVNYVNLATARAVDRAKEVGMRKVVGARKKQLVWQFLFEAMLLNLLATLAALTLVQLCMPVFEQLVGKSLFSIWTDETFWFALSGIFVLGAVVSSIYPAFVLSSFRPLTVLKGKFRHSSKGIVLRKALVIFQFAASVFLIAGTIVVYRQIEYMRNQDLGMNLDQVLVLKAPRFADDEDSVNVSQFKTFRHEISRLAGVQNVASSVPVPAGGLSNIGSISGGIWWEKNITEDHRTIYYAPIDPQFFDTYQIELLAGRSFSEEIASDTGRVVVLNKAALELLDFENPEQAIDENVLIGMQESTKYRIIGVIENFNRLSLKNEVEPTMYRCRLPGSGLHYSIKLGTNNMHATLSEIENVWRQIYPNTPFEYFFADDQFNAQYQTDQQFGSVFSVFAILAIFVACLGLYGLSSFIAFQRTKEIGVRKVLGASIIHILLLLSSDFIRLIFISFLLGFPLAWFVMQNWLNTYAHHTQMAWWIIGVAGLAIVLVVLITVSFQTIKAALINPAHSLRNE